MRHETDSAQRPNSIPAEINLPPTAAEASRCRLRVVIAMPVLTPRGKLERTEPPDVLAGIHTPGKSGLKVQQTVYERLHVQAVHKTNGAHPEQPYPTKKKITEADRQDDQRNLNCLPCQVARMNQVWTPLLHGRRSPLVQPSHMCPPESAVAWTGNVFNCIGVGMMISVIRDPRARRTRSIEDSTKNKELFENRIQFNRAMSEGAMVSDRGSESTQAGENQCREEYFPSRRRKQHDTNQCQYMYGNYVNKRPGVFFFDLPPFQRPRMLSSEFGPLSVLH